MRKRLSWSLARLVWLAMLVSHVVWLGRAVAGGAAISSQWLLAASAVFFLLKFFDLRVLRVPITPRSIAVLFIVVALLHAGVVERSIHKSTTDTTVPLWTVAVAASVAVLRRRLRVVVLRFLAHFGSAGAWRAWSRVATYLCLRTAHQRRPSLFGSPVFAPGRAPPGFPSIVA